MSDSSGMATNPSSESVASDPLAWAALTGQQPESSLASLPGHTNVWLHPDVIAPLLALQDKAARQGFQLKVASGFRSFERQRLIWNGKACGSRPVMDAEGQALDMNCLNDEQKLFAILRWSAIPGCSRHHWGTDMDVYDAAAVADDYVLQLTPAETTGEGPFAPFHNWLDQELAQPSCEFYRPYAVDCGGIAPERWHLSHQPTAQQFEQLLDEQRLLEWVLSCDIALKQPLAQHWHEIFQRYVMPPGSAT